MLGDEQRTVDRIIQRIRLERSAAIHADPAGPLSVTQAQAGMRIHLGCSVSSCDYKHACWDALIAAGKIVPDMSRTLY
jgi:hypothetical protein